MKYTRCDRCGRNNGSVFCNICVGADMFVPKASYTIRYKDYSAIAKSEVVFDPFHKPQIKNVIFDGPATIVFWTDGDKTVVKCQDGDTFDPEKGLAMAIAKKYFGNKGRYCNEIKKWTEKYYEEDNSRSRSMFEMIVSRLMEFDNNEQQNNE